MILNGQSAGSDFADLKRQAKNMAADFFGTHCVKVNISEADLEETRVEWNGATMGYTFRADWTAEEKHHMETLVYGPAKCRDCGKRNHEL